MVGGSVLLCPGLAQMLAQSSLCYRSVCSLLSIIAFNAKVTPSIPTQVAGNVGISSQTALIMLPDPGAADAPRPKPHLLLPRAFSEGHCVPQMQWYEAPKFSLSLYLICKPLHLTAPSCPVTCGGQECLLLLSGSLMGMLNKQGRMSVPAVPHPTPPQSRSLPTCCYLLFSFPGSRQSAWQHMSPRSPGAA